MKNLKECLAEAQDKKVAIGHFNVSNLEAVWGIFRAAKKLNVPVIIGTAEGESDFVGIKQISAVVKSIREEFDYPIFLNGDHIHSFEKVKDMIDAGYDSVIYDGVELSFEENLKITKQCVEYAKSVNPNILIEAELGFIGKSSTLLDEVPEGAGNTEEFLTKPEDAKKFVDETGVDMLAPAVGSIHGMLKTGHDPRLNIERIKAIKETVGIPLVLHGGSGLLNEDFTLSISAGISIVHINTEIRVAYKDALKKSLQEKPDEIAPYKILKGTVEAIQTVVEARLKLFNNIL